MKWLQSILPLVLVVITALAPQFQALIAQHPIAAALIAGAGAVINHLSPPPQK